MTHIFPASYKLCKRIRNPDGIRVSDLIDALNECAPIVLQTWGEQAKRLHEEVQIAHWIDDIWKLPASPQFRIYLDNTEMSDKEIRDAEPIPSEAYTLADDVHWYNMDQAAKRTAHATMEYAAHITRAAYMAAEPLRREREGKWIPEELFEPMKSETGRHPIDWNT